MHTENGPKALDISILAIKATMDIYKVQDQRECLLKVLKTFHHFEAKGNQ